MASIISAGTTDATSLNVSSDKTGILQLASNNAVTAVTIDTSQNVGIGTTSPTALTSNKALTINSPTGFGSLLDLKTNETLNLRVFSNATNSGLSVKTATPLLFETNDTTRMTIDSSGNVGVGTTSTSAKLSVSVGGVSTLGQQSNQALALLGGGSNNQLCQIGMGYGTGATYTPTAIGSITTTQTGYTIADLIFATRSVNTDTAPTERMRINSDGRVYSGSASPWTVGSGGVNAWALYNGGDFPLTVASQSTITGIFNRCTSTGTVVEFKYNASPKGTISTDGSTVAYNTSSDYRLKDEVTPMSGALDKVSELKPVTWKWKSTNENGQGFIAHELAEVCPQAVHGTKDAVDADGNPVYQGIDTSFLVATLTAAIQELKAINDTQAETINALTARLEALENK